MTKKLILIWGVVSACSSSEPPENAAVGGAALGPADSHCGARAQVTSAYACGGQIGTKTLHPQHTDGGVAVYLPAMYGTSGADDDCKYDVSWTSTPVRESSDFTVDFTVTTRADHAPASGGSAYVEAYLDDTHPASTRGTTTTETSPGVYRIGPLRFDRAGRWTMRLHVFDGCLDETPDSPHGHASFYVDVP